MSLELGPHAEHEIEAALHRDFKTERWTRLDAKLQRHADDPGIVDLWPEAGVTHDLGQNATHRDLLTGRAQTLEPMGLATPEGSGRWALAPGMADRLREMSARGHHQNHAPRHDRT